MSRPVPPIGLELAVTQTGPAKYQITGTQMMGHHATVTQRSSLRWAFYGVDGTLVHGRHTTLHHAMSAALQRLTRDIVEDTVSTYFPE